MLEKEILFHTRFILKNKDTDACHDAHMGNFEPFRKCELLRPF